MCMSLGFLSDTPNECVSIGAKAVRLLFLLQVVRSQSAGFFSGGLLGTLQQHLEHKCIDSRIFCISSIVGCPSSCPFARQVAGGPFRGFMWAASTTRSLSPGRCGRFLFFCLLLGWHRLMAVL